MGDERLITWKALYDEAVQTLKDEEGLTSESMGSLQTRSLNAA
jgi:hypothetical protein